MTPVTTAMVLAAGLGTRMRPITATTPKPLITVGGKALLDWTLDALAQGGVSKAVVNVHHLAEQVRGHVARRTMPRVVISDESAQLLETGGGIVKALPLLGGAPFFAANTDAFTVRSSRTPAEWMLSGWGDDVDAVLLLHPMDHAHGFDGPGDFFIAPGGVLRRRDTAARAPLVFAGLQLIRPDVFAGLTPEPFSMNRIWDRLMGAGRLRGVVQDGEWFHVGTPAAIPATERALAAMDARRS
jgi:MurNAc alpha-1-phosphate uridylyltransferase